MATLLWFLAGMAVIIGVARYNQDDNLFWKLFIAYVGSFTAATVVKTYVENDSKKDKVVMIDNAPTQVLQSTSCAPYSLADVSLAATKREKSPKPVSKDSLVDINDSILSEVHTHARGPTQFCMYFDDS